MLYEAFRTLCLLPASSGAPCSASAPQPAPARAYQVSYRLKLATLRYGRVVDSFFVPAACRFPTNELNVILAELYGEVGPAPHLLGSSQETEKIAR